MIQKISTTPNPILRNISQPIKEIDQKTRHIIRDVEETLTGGDHPRGVGLSAVQIGKPIRMFCIYLPQSGDPDDEKSKLILSTFLNPEIIKVSKDKTLYKLSNGSHQPPATSPQKPVLEGCLSIPGIWGPVWRQEWITLKWQMVNGKWQMVKFAEFPARVIQHELDHLNGILFTDHSLRDKLPIYESRNDKLVEVEII